MADAQLARQSVMVAVATISEARLTRLSVMVAVGDHIPATLTAAGAGHATFHGSAVATIIPPTPPPSPSLPAGNRMGGTQAIRRGAHKARRRGRR